MVQRDRVCEPFQDAFDVVSEVYKRVFTRNPSIGTLVIPSYRRYRALRVADVVVLLPLSSWVEDSVSGEAGQNSNFFPYVGFVALLVFFSPAVIFPNLFTLKL